MAQVDLRRLTRAIVFKGDEPAGEISRDDREVSFRYRPDYPVSGEAVARTLPIRNAPYVERGGAVPAFFAGLLPEGRRLAAIRSRLKTSADDEFTQVIAVGTDCIGDVRVLAETATREPEPVTLSGMPDSFRDIFAGLLERPLDDDAIPGAQEKISSSMISLPAAARWGPAIVKLTPSAFPRIIENEAFFLDLARRCGLEIPRYEIQKDRSGESALVIERFDRRVTRGDLTRIAQEDVMQLMDRWPADKYRITTRELFHAIAQNTSAPPPELRKLTKLVVLSYVIGNGDLHGKNVSIRKVDGIWRLTPVYDVICTLPYGDRTMALDFEGRDDNIRLRDVLAVAGREGLNEKATRAAVLEVCTACEEAIPRIPEIGFDEKRTQDIQRVMAKRIADLRN